MSPDLKTLLHDSAPDPSDGPNVDELRRRAGRRRAVRIGSVGAAGVAIAVAATALVLSQPSELPTPDVANPKPAPSAAEPTQGPQATPVESDEVPTGPRLAVDGSGVGTYAFGTDAGAVIAGMVELFGESDLDSGPVEFHRLAGDPPAGASANDFYRDPRDDWLGEHWEWRWHRLVCWDALCLHLGGETNNRLTLTGWELKAANYDVAWQPGVELDPGRADVALADTGIRLGSSWADVQAAYPGVVAAGGEGNSLWVRHLPWEAISGQWRLSGYWDSRRPEFAPEDSQLVLLSGGRGPEPGCC